MAQPETIVVGAVSRHLEKLGCLVVKMHGSAFSRKGFPDLLVIRPDGVTVYLEVKVPGRRDGPLQNGVSAAQLSWGRKLRRANATWGWAATPEESARVVFPLAVDDG